MIRTFLVVNPNPSDMFPGEQVDQIYKATTPLFELKYHH